MGRFGGFFNNRWFVFVGAIWVQACAGLGYVFGSISPVIKSSLKYNQRQIASLGVAKDLGDSIGFVAGSLSEYLPMWALLFIGAIQNFVGYGLIWLIVSGRMPELPLWAVRWFELSYNSFGMRIGCVMLLISFGLCFLMNN